MNPRRIGRRSLLGGVALSATVAFAADGAGRAAAAASRLRPTRSPQRSANGWIVAPQVNDAHMVWTRPVSGTGMDVDICVGAPEVLLLHVVRRLHYEVRPMLSGELQGWRPITELRRRGPESNLASGTALRVRPGSRSDAYFPLELSALRDILADCQGLVRWGGDDPSRDQSLFYIDVPPESERLQLVGAALRQAAETPGAGPGVAVPFLESHRVKRARAVARSQR